MPTTDKPLRRDRYRVKGEQTRPSAKISNGPGLGFKLLGAGLTGTSGADAGIVDQDVEPIRRRLDRTEDLVRPRRALARLLQLEEQPAAAL